MTSTDPIIEFIGLIKREIPNVETAEELLAVGKIIVHVLGAPQDTP